MVDSTLMGLQIYWNTIKQSIYCFQSIGSHPEQKKALLGSSEQIFAHFLEGSHRALPCRKDIAGLLLLPPDFLTCLSSTKINQLHQKASLTSTNHPETILVSLKKKKD